MTDSRHRRTDAKFNPEEAATIVGTDPGLQAVLARAARVAPTHIPVLISGESGTGKELLAESLHRQGRHPDGPFVAVNCGALPRELAESELFGHERGAFTGAGQRKAGWFEEADGGTLVLDEVGELPLDLQPKLLRVLESGRLRRVGGSGEVSVRVRVVAVTLRDLRHDAARGTFRNDLYHRLAGFELMLPPLRQRRGDIPLLAERFLAEMSRELGREGAGRGVDATPYLLDEEAMRDLTRYDWPGNVRELRNVLRRAVVLSQGLIDSPALELPHAGPPEHGVRPGAPVVPDSPGWGRAGVHLADEDDPDPSDPRRLSWTGAAALGPPSGDNLPIRGRTFNQIERAVFLWALAQNGGSRRQAARALGLPRSSFSDKVKRYGLA